MLWIMFNLQNSETQYSQEAISLLFWLNVVTNQLLVFANKIFLQNSFGFLLLFYWQCQYCIVWRFFHLMNSLKKLESLIDKRCYYLSLLLYFFFFFRKISYFKFIELFQQFFFIQPKKKLAHVNALYNHQ